MSILPPKKSFPPFTREWLEEVAKNEPDCDITAGVHSELREGGDVRIYKPGYVESELAKIAKDPHYLNEADLRHAIGMLAAGILLILEKQQEQAVKAAT